jgi:hypothetical protein
MAGYGTKTWRNSAEKHAVDKERAEATKQFQPVRDSVEVRIQCCCSAREWRHDPMEVHGQEWPVEWTPR